MTKLVVTAEAYIAAYPAGHVIEVATVYAVPVIAQAVITDYPTNAVDPSFYFKEVDVEHEAHEVAELL